MKYLLSLCVLLSCAIAFGQNSYPANGNVTINGGNIKLTNPPSGVNINMNVSSGSWAREFGFSIKDTGKAAAFGAYGGADSLQYTYIGGNTTASYALDDFPAKW